MPGFIFGDGRRKNKKIIILLLLGLDLPTWKVTTLQAAVAAPKLPEPQESTRVPGTWPFYVALFWARFQPVTQRGAHLLQRIFKEKLMYNLLQRDGKLGRGERE